MAGSRVRPDADPDVEAELIDVTGVDLSLLDALPDSILYRALLRARQEHADQIESYSNFTDGPSVPKMV